jgi:hypothetical protein
MGAIAGGRGKGLGLYEKQVVGVSRLQNVLAWKIPENVDMASEASDRLINII